MTQEFNRYYEFVCPMCTKVQSIGERVQPQINVEHTFICKECDDHSQLVKLVELGKVDFNGYFFILPNGAFFTFSRFSFTEARAEALKLAAQHSCIIYVFQASFDEGRWCKALRVDNFGDLCQYAPNGRLVSSTSTGWMYLL
jgi:hypothetical protein